ncbi:hypothetical protein KP509_23G078200 [Ceratopteris richardii]|uniref:Letm1 RBD domain-containing protein n=1 Tax=Ceratopteris richardii TaxID=49495 RepID=A0A8T2S3C2_CERRI|nr:hypothetical protein KP509_23G078200 [Ceratopteris richardii]
MAYRHLIFGRRKLSSRGLCNKFLGRQTPVSCSSLIGFATRQLSNGDELRDVVVRREGLVDHGVKVWKSSDDLTSASPSEHHASAEEGTKFTDSKRNPLLKRGNSNFKHYFHPYFSASLEINCTDKGQNSLLERGKYEKKHFCHPNFSPSFEGRKNYGKIHVQEYHKCVFPRGIGSSLPLIDDIKGYNMQNTVYFQEDRVFVRKSSSLNKNLPQNLPKVKLFSSVSSPSSAAQYEESSADTEQVKKTKPLEPSPEECDEAVVGLSSAKAKAKKTLEVQSKGLGIIKKIWHGLLGFGPALRAVASMSREDWAKKLTHWREEFWATLKHYWVGTKLLWADVRISSRLLLRLASGKSLTRRERQQLTRTTADIFRLFPFAVFVIVPFMEFLLPVFLKVFPNMLPSTFQDKMKEQEKLKRKLNARIEYAKFLQDTVKEMAKEIKTTRSGEVQRTAEDLDQFMTKVRRGETVLNDDILGFAKLFNDELTLDNISRPRLVSMCKYMNIKPYGTDAYLRHMLRSKLAWIKEDDRMIQSEGVESLSEAELRAACRERGMLGLLSVGEMRQQLKDWLDLSLNHSLPSSLLLLSRAFLVSGKVRPEEAVQATLSSLPDEVVESVGVMHLPSDDVLAERTRKLEFLHKEEELIKEEMKKDKVQEEKLKADVKIGETDIALESMNADTARELATEKFSAQQKDLCELSSALAVLASASSVSKERAEFLRLVNKEIALYSEMVEKEGKDGAAEARKAYQAAHEDRERSAQKAKVSTALVEKIDTMLHKLEKEIDAVDAQIGDRLKLLDRFGWESNSRRVGCGCHVSQKQSRTGTCAGTYQQLG